MGVQIRPLRGCVTFLILQDLIRVQLSNGLRKLLRGSIRSGQFLHLYLISKTRDFVLYFSNILKKMAYISDLYIEGDLVLRTKKMLKNHFLKNPPNFINDIMGVYCKD